MMTFGEALDAYLHETKKPAQDVQSVYLYPGMGDSVQVVVITSEYDYDYTDVLATHHNVTEEINTLRQEKQKLQAKVKQLSADKRDIEKSLEVLARFNRDSGTEAKQ